MEGGGCPRGRGRGIRGGKETQKERHRDGERRSEIRREGRVGGTQGERAGGRGREKRREAGCWWSGGARPHTDGDGEAKAHPPPLPGPHQPSTGALSSSETPKDMAPMKSLREVRSQSHTSTLSRRSTSPGFRLLREGWGGVRVKLPTCPASPSLVLEEEASPSEVSWGLFLLPKVSCHL